jgi:predicted nucleic acid-binding protein
MDNSIYLLDSFALLAYLNNESGKPRVQAILADAEKKKCQVLMCMVNLGEVLYQVERLHGFYAAQRTLVLSESLPIGLLDATRELVLAAAHIKANHPLSYADAFAVAAAQKQNAIILTGDPEFEMVKSIVYVEWLPKKS